MTGWGSSAPGPSFPELESRFRGVECDQFTRKGAVMLRLWLTGLAGFVLLAIAAQAADQANPLANDPQAAKLGEYQFRINCALCHGLGARGGGRGPDLTRPVKKHTHSDSDMFQVISNGISGTAMPANGTNGQGVGMTDKEIWQIITYIRSQEAKAPAQVLA